MCEYTGEVDQEGNLCGEGKAFCETNSSRMKGTFFDNKEHGIGKSLCLNNVLNFVQLR